MLGITRERFAQRGSPVMAELPPTVIVSILDALASHPWPLSRENFEAVAQARGREQLPDNPAIWTSTEYSFPWCVVSITQNDLEKGIMMPATTPVGEDEATQKRQTIDDFQGLTGALEPWVGRAHEEPGEPHHVWWVYNNTIRFHVEVMGDQVMTWFETYDGEWIDEDEFDDEW